MLRIGKSWQCQPAGMVWQVKTQNQKGYLVLYANGRCGLQFEKPKELVVHGGFVAQTRKHIPSGFCAWVHMQDDGIWFALTKHPKADVHAYLYLHQKEQELSLILADRTQLVRLTPNGTYTRKKTWEGSFPTCGQNLEELFTWEEQPQKKVEQEDISQHPAQRKLKKSLKRKLKTLKQSFLKAESAYEKVCDLKTIEQEARLLQMYAWKGASSDGFLHLSEEETGGVSCKVVVKDPYDMGKSVEWAFRYFKKAKRTAQISAQRMMDMQKQIETLECCLTELEQTVAWLRLLELGRRYKISVEESTAQKRKDVLGTQLREFVSADGLRMIVGRNAEENDKITAQAKSSDWWFHVADGKGSHVIVQGQKSVDLPEKTKNQAMMLAVHFSGRRRDLSGDVYVVRRYDLMRSRDKKQGRWEMRRAAVVPTRYTEQDLATVLGSYEYGA